VLWPEPFSAHVGQRVRIGCGQPAKMSYLAEWSKFDHSTVMDSLRGSEGR
jgi:hypothetical protein